ncbi:MAG TPA: YraN family protein [Terriglobales bacterium]|nr:YraN family protein [Terriglobales bacterium]
MVSVARWWIEWRRTRTLPESHRLGRRGEELAERTLRGLGYTVVGRNVRCAGLRGEIDLIARDHGTLVFVEVKTRRRLGLYPARFAVNRAKQRNLQRVARAYRQENRERGRYRFDIVSIYQPDAPRPRIEHAKYAFREVRYWHW